MFAWSSLILEGLGGLGFGVIVDFGSLLCVLCIDLHEFRRCGARFG